MDCCGTRAPDECPPAQLPPLAGPERHLHTRHGVRRHLQRIRVSLSLTGDTNCLAVTCTALAGGGLVNGALPIGSRRSRLLPRGVET